MLRLGLLGCGQMARYHAETIADLDKAKFTAFGDVIEAAAEEMSRTFGGRYATRDCHKIINDPEIDAVYICTRHDSHASLAIAALEQGKHVMLEKPLALDMESCERIAAAAEAADAFLMPAFKMRYYPLIQKAHDFIPEPQVIVAQMMDNRWGDDHWAQDPVQGGANVHSQGCHTTDILRYFANSEPVQIYAAGGALSHPGHPCIDQCVASITFANGHVASWIQGDAALGHLTSKFFFQLFGHGKSVQLNARCTSATFSDGQETWTEVREDEEGLRYESEEFIAAILENRPPELTAHDGLQATRIVLAADRSIRTGKAQTL